MFEVQGVSTFLQNIQSQDPMVSEILAEESLVLVIGRPGTSKSWFAMDLGLSIVSGEPFLGKFDIAGEREVVFIGQDSSCQDYRRQLSRLVQGKGLHDFEDRFGSFKFMVQQGLDLPDNKKELLASMERYAMRDQLPGLVVVDSLRSVHSGEENDATAMRRVMDSFKLLRDKLKCCVLVIHHEPHPKKGEWTGRPAGSREIEAASDCIFRMSALGKRKRLDAWSMEQKFRCDVMRTRGMQPPDMEYLLSVNKRDGRLILTVSKEDAEAEILELATKGISRDELAKILSLGEENVRRSTLDSRVTKAISDLKLERVTANGAMSYRLTKG